MIFGLAGFAASQEKPCCEGMDGDRDAGWTDTNEIMVEVIATLVVDSVWVYGPRFTRFTSFKTVTKTQVDTSLFRNAGPSNLTRSFTYDPAGFPDSHVDSVGYWSFRTGDTLKNVFVLQSDKERGRKSWHITGIQCKFLAQTQPPFPAHQAMASLNSHLDSLALAKGQKPPEWKLKLGPVFILTPGDPGQLVTAYHDADSWIVTHQIGSGDCPAGCTIHDEHIYRIDAKGKVTLVSSRQFFSLCFKPITLRKPPIRGPLHDESDRFQVDGREVKETPASGRPGQWVFPRGVPKR